MRCCGLIEAELGPDGAAIRDALSQLQLAYAQLAGGPPAGGPAAPGGPATPQDPAPQADPAGPGPAQSSGRLWIPGQ